MNDNSRFIIYLEHKAQARESREKDDLIKTRERLYENEARMRMLERERERMNIQMRMKDVEIRTLKQRLEFINRVENKL